MRQTDVSQEDENAYSSLSETEKQLLEDPDVVFVTCRRSEAGQSGRELHSVHFAFNTRQHDLLLIEKDSAVTKLVGAKMCKAYQAQFNATVVEERSIGSDGSGNDEFKTLQLNDWLPGLKEKFSKLPQNDQSSWPSYFHFILDPSSSSTPKKSKVAKLMRDLDGNETALLESIQIPGMMDQVDHTIMPGKVDEDDSDRTIVDVPLASIFMLHVMCNNAETAGLPTYDPRGYFLLSVALEGNKGDGKQQLIVSVSRDINVSLG